MFNVQHLKQHYKKKYGNTGMEEVRVFSAGLRPNRAG